MTKEGEIKKPVDISEILTYPPEKYPFIYESKRYKRKAPQSFKYKQSVEEVAQRLGLHIAILLHQFTQVHSISVSGMIGEKKKSITWKGGGSYYEDGEGFRIENKDYKRHIEKSKVTSPIYGNYEEATKHLASVRLFLNSLPKLERTGVELNDFSENIKQFGY